MHLQRITKKKPLIWPGRELARISRKPEGRYLTSKAVGGLAHEVKSGGKHVIDFAERGESRRILRSDKIPVGNVKPMGKTEILAIKDKQGNPRLMPALKGSFVSDGAHLGVVSKVLEDSMVISVRFQRDGSNYHKLEKRDIIVKAEPNGTTGWDSVGIKLK